jgi:hypothetical protein
MPDEDVQEMLSLLDQELIRLPEKYRVPIILCDLEGKSRRDAARQLNLPERTLSTRVARGRVMLARRLSRAGKPVVGAAGAAAAATVCQNVTSASVPASLLGSTVRAPAAFLAGKLLAAGPISARAAGLGAGVIQSMLLTKLKLASGVCLVCAMLAGGAGIFMHSASVENPAETKATATPEKKQAKDGLKTPSISQLVDYLNDNARRIHVVRFKDIEMTCSVGLQQFGIRGKMIAQPPRGFLMTIDVFGKREIDIGSNDREFWYWIAKAEPARQFYCSYKDLAGRRARKLPFPFPPDWIMEALGLAAYGPPERYTLMTGSGEVTLVEATRTPDGKPLRKLIVMKRKPVRSPAPQVVQYLLQDGTSGREICSARITETQVDDGGSGKAGILPRRMEFRWVLPDERRLKLAMKLDGMEVNPRIKSELFVRRPIQGVRSCNLAGDATEDR